MISRQLRRVDLDRGLHERVLVLGVRDERPHEGAQPLVVGRERLPVAGVDVARGDGHAEELAADAFVDVLVAIEGDGFQVGGLDGECRADGSDGHGLFLSPGAPHSWIGTDGMRFRTIMRTSRGSRS